MNRKGKWEIERQTLLNISELKKKQMNKRNTFVAKRKPQMFGCDTWFYYLFTNASECKVNGPRKLFCLFCFFFFIAKEVVVDWERVECGRVCLRSLRCPCCAKDGSYCRCCMLWHAYIFCHHIVDDVSMTMKNETRISFGAATEKSDDGITRPDTRLPKWHAGGQGPYLRSIDHLGRSSEVKK